MKPRIGMIGLGGIAQKAYLPILSKEVDWTFVGAYSPNKQKREQICNHYRIKAYEDLSSLSESCDAIFVHSSTETHYEIVSQLLRDRIDVYVDKPLAATIEQAEKLVHLSEALGRKLMVGFNRRFSPMYVKLKKLLKEKDTAWINLEKHRIASINDTLSYEHILLDDYLHLVDTVRWLSDGDIRFENGFLKTIDSKLAFTQQQFQSDDNIIFNSSMHRSAGTNLEQLELVTTGGIFRVKNMNIFECETDNQLSTFYSGSWESILKQKGFEHAVNHFIQCIQQNIEPSVPAREGLESQILLQELILHSKRL
ncbi:Gfo/Idh/MocA family protein [Shouchella clausii]|uniref:Gfo/Idh/MocA family protein n=1 Tax=Shouchella clausii TaxID=79880 RepID=UPI000BA74659|nr:Gfo/Idh/MocA family oxidoreductase [Shouchella clausii]PAD90314.1 virulence factor MviM [Shouchella clausii]